ncbi:hydroxymethylglutaryl-CoA reductase, degradative [Membranihabitans maritimus]|uniref:hydroxymethylglutaryl-CoA reductase, degradative n=1 Tax=Membranihabitans maritimus TaxID=2904244 RepID=UPI001F026771
MKKNKSIVDGFSKFTKLEKLNWLTDNFFDEPEESKKILQKYWIENKDDQKVFDRISENTVSNFILPFSIAPNFIINGKPYAIPMVIEESSVVAAASGAAKYWREKGGFKATVLQTTKLGQIHFHWRGNAEDLLNAKKFFNRELMERTVHLTQNMKVRGGGIKKLEIKVFPEKPDYYQFLIHFETCNSMGANFINSVLEHFANEMIEIFYKKFGSTSLPPSIIMSILSNYTPECLVHSEVTCPVSQLKQGSMSGEEFAKKFKDAVDIAVIDPYRATTHNKGIFNGVDAVVLATGNDFRAIEAAGHAYASRDGQYRSLSKCYIENEEFKFQLDLPLAIGTVGGLTGVHPLAKISLELLGYPSAHKLMEIIASAGLAQNFAAIRSLITTGIQKGHMKMHLINILNHLNADNEEIEQTIRYFKNKVVTFTSVRAYLSSIRN